MPYIKISQKIFLDRLIGELIGKIIALNPNSQAGLVNHTVACLIAGLIADRGTSYAVLNEFIGALECCKLELYRRLIVPYEDEKIKQNGDVF